MTGLYLPSSTGAYVKVTKGLWASDSSGTFRPVKNAWATKADGSYTKVWPYTASVDAFTAVKGSPSYRVINLAWAVTNTDHVELRLSGTTAVLYSGTGASYSYTGVPGTKYSFSLRAFAADGSYIDWVTVSATLDALPAPSGFKRNSGAYNSSAWAWSAVANADNYQVVDTMHANALKGQVNAPAVSWNETGLTASTVYERAVQANLGSARSAVSNKVRYTSPVAPGSPAGTYDFRSNYAEAWAPGYASWRGSGSGAAHGNGDNWGGGNGNNSTWFFYDLAAIRALSGRVTRFKIHMVRDSSAGYSSPQTNHFMGHVAGSRPSGNPTGYEQWWADAGALAWGQEALIDLPVSWGQSIIDSGLGGFVWGGVAGRYMRGPSLGSNPDIGRIYITLG